MVWLPTFAFSCPCRYPCVGSPQKRDLLCESDGIAWNRGDQLWAAGEHPDWMLAVCTGAVGLRRGPGKGPGTLIDIVARGGLAGEEAAIENCPRVTDCVGLVPGRGRRLSRDRMRELLTATPDGWPAVMQSTCRRLDLVAERMLANAHDQVSSRLARALVRLAQQAGLPDARGVLLPLPLSRQDLAELVGCRMETVVRQMRRWDSDGVLETVREGFILHQLDVLEEHAGAPDAVSLHAAEG